MPRVNEILISYCGLVCEYCPAYRLKLCEGCDAHESECRYIQCLKKHGNKNCLLCNEFPCKLHEEGFNWETTEYGVLKWKIYSEVFIDLMKKLRRDNLNGNEARQ